ncbi:MAG TPA: PfkB family carbohydrate kinase, partial [Actinomycetota bacterium]|nr:PfkB family carbohydrate kinase [Actinomycetota bacterium]
SEGRGGSYRPVAPPGPVVDTYGAGDSFAAGLTFALGRGLEVEDALALAARCGAWCASGRGPYGNQLTASDLT